MPIDLRSIIARTHLVLAVLGLVTAASIGAQLPPASDALRPGDVLRLRIFREPEMSSDFTVDERGQVTLPRLGLIDIARWPADSIRPRLVRSFSEYLRNPSIEVLLLRRIAVSGSVMKPGLYPVDPTMTVQDALALAGGASADGRRDRVELRRGDQRLVADLTSASTIGSLRLASGDQLFVPQRGWLSRNTWLVSTLIGATATVTTILITR